MSATVITPRGRSGSGQARRAFDLWLLLAWRDVRLRYRQAFFGVLWALVQPLAAALALGLFLRRDTAGLLAGLLPWFFFANAVSAAANSLTAHPALVTKASLPRLVLPLAALGAPAVDLLLGLAAFALLFTPGSSLLLVPMALVGLAAFAAGVGVLLAALAARYRDVRHAVPVLVQFGLFATPAIYRAELTDLPRWVMLNPLHGLVAAVRAGLGAAVDVVALALALLASASVLFVGCVVFRRVEVALADVI